jgi:nucleoside-diphosphate kinase
MALEGPDAVQAARNTIGATKPIEATAGSIRGDFGMMVGRNLVHGSDSPENGAAEISLWFDESELISYERVLDRWILE